MRVRPPGGSFSVLVVLLLIGGHLIPRSAHEGLVEAAISTQRSPQTAKRPFIMHSGAFFFSKINIPHSPASLAKLPHLYFIHNKPTSPRNMAPHSLFPFSAAQFHPPVFPFALKRAAEAVGRRSEADCPLRLHAAY